MSVLAINLSNLGGTQFWIGVLVIAGVYGIFTLGLQLNVGYTGIFNFGQAGFMAVGAYAMGILVVKAGFSFWAALPVATLIAMGAGVLIGLPSLRLRADYFAIATIAFGEIVRYIAQNARGLTGGNQGLLGFDSSWTSISNSISSSLGLGPNLYLVPLLIVAWVLLILLALGMRGLQNTPWGRVLRGVREDEDAVRALGKNPFPYKLQSLAIASLLAAVSGYLLALDLAFLNPAEFLSNFTFVGYAMLILGGLASYFGVIVGALIMEFLLEATRSIALPLNSDKIAALRFIIVGLVLIGLMAFRPQGIFGKRDEMVLGE
jgi:branched-chain amino acid transport system permease protein